MPPTDFEDVGRISVPANPLPLRRPSFGIVRTGSGQKVTLNLPNALRGGATAVPEKKTSEIDHLEAVCQIASLKV